MTYSRSLLTTILANCLLVAAILVFASGFFPYKAVLPGLAAWDSAHGRSTVPAPFDKVIFMVVDALRSDFVYSNASNFFFTQSLIRSGAAVPFTGHASAPTITMPRVKAITTGSVPSFVDLVLNFAESDTSSTLATQDSWLAQVRAMGSGKLVMYGDDTWLRLFPGFFDRADGTTSFFVSDFTEVDNNVTRHVPEELEKDDWAAMTLHFLGLDHIGHKTGPKGPNMPAKQAEMDSIVKTIYEAMESRKHLESTVLVLLGDHGMTEAGNHGASSAGEVSTALTFISPKFKSTNAGLVSPTEEANAYEYYKTYEQSDIAPTLAALLGFPVPTNNLGVMIPDMLQLFRYSDQRQLLFQNARQIHKVAAATFPSIFDSATPEICASQSSPDLEQLACDWIDHGSSVESLYHFLYKAQRTLSGAASDYDVSKLQLGVLLSTLSIACATFSMFLLPNQLAMGICSVALIAISYGVTMFASSYVEEEHQFWYWTTGGWLVILYSKGIRWSSMTRISNSTAIGIVLLLFGITRRWKQTGQKYATDPDLVSDVITTKPWLLWSILIGTYAVVSSDLSNRASRWMNSRHLGLLPVLVVMSAFVFKVAFTSADAPELARNVTIIQPVLAFTWKYPLVSIARVAFFGFAQLMLCNLYFEAPWKSRRHLLSCFKGLQDILTLFLMTQTRTVNIPLFVGFYFQLLLMERCNHLTEVDISITSILLQYASFFAFGGTNAISSVDLSNAYNGITGYNVLAVGLLTFVSNWAGPIWWSVATCRLLIAKASSSTSHATFQHFARLTLFVTISTSFVMAACLALREHLFIWTVFSPKYLYTLAWIFGQHIFVNGLCTIALQSQDDK